MGAGHAIATGEIGYGRWYHKEMLEKQAASIVQTDALVCGGITEWQHLRTYRIPRALPAYPVGGYAQPSVRLASGLYACGDHREHPSLNGALASGRRAAEAVLADSI